ncbi:GAF domain-containing protein [Tenacibaculum sp. M341]|uniref:GAF domain-containing protein n=1 Tax=Tenacibaculum sp. M341 TaxID=2530339 RepID=UPI00104A8DDC|nr:GAF domain-containing protein [Tenacibaculum sp. M341]TCI93577.1 GAF domain-containing protein [Tenacibaculum sp. M341]
MTIRSFYDTPQLELPLQINISFKKIYEVYKKYTDEAYKNHPYHQSALEMVKKIDDVPEIIEGFTDFSLLEKHSELIELLLETLFPEILTTNEIKAATLPFTFLCFKFTERFENILKNAGEDYEFKVRNFKQDDMYIYACTLILATIYNRPVDLKRPFYFDIPDVNAGITRYYRVAFNGDFMEIAATKDAPEITKEDIELLLDNFDNIEIWKEKFPPNSYIFKGFGLMNLFDITPDETIASIKDSLVGKEDTEMTERLQDNLRNFFAIQDLQVGYSVFDVSNISEGHVTVKRSESILLDYDTEITCNEYFCDHLIGQIFRENKSVVLSDTNKYKERTNSNKLSLRLIQKNIQSIILIPVTASNDDLVLLEIASPRAYELNSVNKEKLKDIIPVFRAAAERKSEEFLNILEATIQEYYTSIHPSVKWRFYDAAENYQNAIYKDEDAKIEQITFKDVYPLYGQLDIRGSSTARNQAIKEDLQTQLKAAINVLKEACKKETLPIYDELMYRVNEYLLAVNNGIKAGDEVSILDFLKREIYPVFNHIKEINEELTQIVNEYLSGLDSDLQVVYNKRKNYEHSVTKINDKLAKFIDKKQEEAQAIFPHYFERYKTDGVEYNMYIGQSITKSKKYDSLYLYNLRLWQLQTTYEMEIVANNLRKSLEHDLQVASLILVHSNPLSIEFRMDEKQFDVDGAYNIRYEIIKKRIDKAHIKGTNERLTVPGKISIVYSQNRDADEYLKYIKYLQSKNQLGAVELLDIEDLQGVSGLKAIRVEVIYKDENTTKVTEKKSTISIDELIKDLK